ncbi:MAG: carboxypeptidase regulatory-like domain-containing protein [Acidobacteriota bacterium]|nr:carboxypeptidase regulatory-like domain-containing protein [Acidobacteriota bacterium]
MFARPFALLLLIGSLAAPAWAQEQRGTLEGVVKDASGSVLPGATVEATATQTTRAISTVTDTSGVFRFPSVAPGIYTLTASLAGFTAKTATDVRVGLGQVKKVDFSLALAGIVETVQVTAETPLVDVRNTARQSNIRAEQVELLPHGRDFTTMVTQAAGANQESKLGGISIDGASAGENRFIIDGIETTNLRNGTSGTGLIADFVEEVQVKSSGYTAEYGGATGGVINAVTKSGTNDWHGSALLNFQGSSLAGNRKPSLRQNLVNSDIAEYITYPKDDESRIEPGFSIGGPIMRNRAWFFGAYQPVIEKTTRNVSPASAGNPSAATASVEQETPAHNITANVNSQIANSVRGRVSYNSSRSETQGLLPALTGTDPAGTNYSKTSKFPNYAVSGNIDWVASPRIFVGLRGGYFMADQHDSNVTEEPRVIFSTGNNIGLLATPVSLQRPTGFQNIPNNNKVTRDQQTRLYFQADGTLYGNAGGAHQVKFGVQADRVGNDVFLGESRNLVRIRWNTALGGLRGPYGYYQVRSNGVSPKQGFITEGNVHTTNIGLFIQDAWTINNRLTINAGVRTERERVPTFSTDAGIPEFGLEFKFADKLAPRLGFAYDIKGDGNWKVFGSWGVFYDIFKLELPRGSFGGDKWLEYYYTLDTPDWTNLVGGANCPPACTGTLIRGPIDFRHPSFGSDAIDPDLKPMRLQEASAGLEHQLNEVMAVSVRYVHKQVDKAIEDTGALDAQGNEIYIIANPGFNLAELAFTNPNVQNPKAVRDYDSVEFAFDKKYADNWYLRTSYMWSRLYGNYSGLSQSDENGRTSPNVGRLWDYPLMMFQDGGTAALGPLATDRPHQFKTQFIYLFGFGTSLGLNEYVASGLPVTREIGIYAPNNLPVQYLGRGSDGRTPMFSQTDMYIQHGFKVGGSREVQVSLNVLNLFNQGTAVAKYSTYHKTNGVTPDETAFYTGRQTLASLITSQNTVKDPRFLMDSAFQAPLQARIGLRFIF